MTQRKAWVDAPERKKFGEDWFRYLMQSTYKTDADVAAISHRRIGGHARVVKIKTKWVTYVRQGQIGITKLYVVTGFVEKEGRRLNVSLPMTKGRAEAFKQKRDKEMKIASPNNRWVRDLRIKQQPRIKYGSDESMR